MTTAQQTEGPTESLAKVLHTSTLYLLYSKFDPLLQLHLNNESKPVNIIDKNFVQDMTVALDTIDDLLKKDRKLAGLIIISDKKNFLVGADIHSMYREVNDQKLGELVARRGQALFDRLAALPVPTIAAINELALGGGLELALACSYRVISANGVVGLPETKLGLLPGAGGTVRTPKLIGLQAALQLILPGGNMRAKVALQRGLVDFVVPDSSDRFKNENVFVREAIKFAQTRALYRPLPKRNRIKYLSWQEQFLNNNMIGRKIVAQQALANLDKTTAGRYPAPYLALDSIYNATHTPNQRALITEAENFGRLAASPESKNLMTIFFMTEDAKKIYKKSRLPNSSNEDVKRWLQEKWINGKVYNPTNGSATYGVIGAGVMGAGIAQLIIGKLQEGATRVYLKDIKDEFVQKGMKFIEDLLRKRKKEKLMAFVKGGTDESELAKCDIIIEAAIEKMDVKKKILQSIESEWIKQLSVAQPTADPDTLLKNSNKIFCTNTSTLSVTELASASKNPANVVGLHFFNPVHRMPLIEIVRGQHTSDETVVHCYNLSLQLGKTPIVVNDGPGFLVNRILGAYLLEAQRLLNEGYNIQQIDAVVKSFGFPMGPFALIDEVGADVAMHSSETLRTLGSRFSIDQASNTFPLSNLVDSGYLGKKTKMGVYDYSKKKDSFGTSILKQAKSYVVSEPPNPFEGLNPKILQIYPNYKGKRSPGTDIMDRIVLAMVNEAAMILQEGVCTSAQDVDVGMIFGTGFCPFRGGLLNYADHRGLRVIVKKLEELSQTFGDRFTPCSLLVRMADSNERFFPHRIPAPVSEVARPPRPRL